jgi:predicted nucleic acid-binding protein
MPGRYFLDANILVYSFDTEARAKLRRATELIREAVASRRGIVSCQVVQEFFNLAFRRFAEPMSQMEAEQYLGTVFGPLLAVDSSVALYQEALAINQRYRMNWFDSLIVAAAMAGECEVLYSEDLQDGQKFGGLQVENPFA